MKVISGRDMEKKSSYYCVDGRSYDVTMTWDENFKLSEKIFHIKFRAVDKETGRELKLAREIATYSIGDPGETLGQRVEHYYGNSREELMSDYLTSAYRRATNWIERGC